MFGDASSRSLRERVRSFVVHEKPDLLKIFRPFRYELDSVWSDLCGRLSPAQRRAVRELRQRRGLRVHIASGPFRMDGWVNVDASSGADIRMDLRRPLPFADDSVAMIFCEHFLDHLQYPDVSGRFLSECRRVLEPSGRLRIVLHDAELIAKAYLARDAAFFRDADPALAVGEDASLPWVEMVNHIFRLDEAHKFIYDFPTLESLLYASGFSAVERSTFLGSKVRELNLDHDSANRSSQSLYVEAVK